MTGFLVRRIVALVVVLFFAVSITFFLIRKAPGGPFDRERKPPEWVQQQQLKKYKLDGSLWSQYTSYLDDLVHGNLRVSFRYRNRSVNELIAQTLPVSALLGLSAFCIATLAGVWVGCFAARNHHTWLDTSSMMLALLAISIPTFVTGPLVILIIGIYLDLLPIGGWGGIQHLILPAIVLAGPYIAYIARLMRTSMLETLKHDFIRTAHAKGVSEQKILYKHALKVAILPVVSFMGPLAAHLLTGSIVVETIFNIPGMGGFFVNSILNRDGFLLGGVVIVYCSILVLLNLAVDFLYVLLDRRIKLYA